MTLMYNSDDVEQIKKGAGAFKTGLKKGNQSSRLPKTLFLIYLLWPMLFFSSSNRTNWGDRMFDSRSVSK